MLSVSKYPQDYVDAMRAQTEHQIAAWADLAAAAKSGDDAPLAAAVATLEVTYFNALVHVLDNYFCHRARGQELKDGNPLNEVRILCASMMSGEGRLVVDKTIKLKSDSSILGYEAGDQIRLTEADFRRLADAFYLEIRAKFA